jgi:hypothetical protein
MGDFFLDLQGAASIITPQLKCYCALIPPKPMISSYSFMVSE